jgi:hypothetical protein
MEDEKYSRENEMKISKIDTATEVFSQIIQKKKNNITELTIKQKLYGNLNLSVLNEEGFTKIKVLLFEKNGYLTSITNFPNTIKKIVASNQLLQKIDLPDNIEHLEIENNLFVGEFSLNNKTNLKYLNVSFNKIESFEELPGKLEELYCDNNLLQNIYLDNCTKLKTLHCDNNPKLSIYNIPDTVTDKSVPAKTNTIVSLSSENEKENNDLQKSYQDSIEDYFALKEKYDKILFKYNSKKNKKKNKAPNWPKCTKCNERVGMVFSGKNQKYTAYCENQNCDRKIVIYRGDNSMFRQTMEEMINILENTKENIIIQKMDTLFNFISEDKSSKLFEDQLSLFQKNSQFVEKYRKQYEDMYFNQQKIDIIQEKKKEIQAKLIELNETDNLEEVVGIQLQIKGISEFIQREMYEYMEVWINRKMEFILDQETVTFSKLEINLGEPVKVG